MLDTLHNENAGKLVLRLTVGILILFHGISKILHPESLAWIEQQLNSMGLPAFIAYGVYAGEVLAAVMVILGIFTRAGGLLIAVNMIFALVLAHTDDIFRLGDHGQWAIELQLFYLLGGISILLLGSGKYALKPDQVP